MHESSSRLNSGPMGVPLAVPAYLAEDQAFRLERIRQAKLLYRGDHASYYLGESRSQFSFRAARVGERVIVPYVKYNALKLATNKTVDLLFGAAPLFRAQDAGQSEAVAALARRSSLHRLLRNTARECCYEGEAFLESVIYKGEAYLRRVLANTIFPAGELMPDGQYERYESYQEDVLPDGLGRPVRVVLKTIWLAGRVERELWTLSKKGTPDQRLELGLWPAFARATANGRAVPDEVMLTGIAENTITYVANEDDHDSAVSDYDGLIELQDMVNHKLTQTAVAIAKHMDPKLGMPRRAADGTGNAQASAEVYFYDTKDDLPEYITWDAQLESALKDRNFGLQGLLINAEISPVLLGLKEGAAPTAYKTLRLEAQNTLAMVARKTVNWTPAVERAIRVTQLLELTLPYYGYTLGEVGVELRDGLPVDEEEQANVIAIERSSGVLSVESAVRRRLGGDAATVATELARLAEERAAATPPILFGGAGGGGGADGGGGVEDGEASTADEEVAA